MNKYLKIDDAPRRADGRASLRRQNAHVNNRIFSPFSSDYYCIYGLLPRRADGDGRRVRFFYVIYCLCNFLRGGFVDYVMLICFDGVALAQAKFSADSWLTQSRVSSIKKNFSEL